MGLALASRRGTNRSPFRGATLAASVVAVAIGLTVSWALSRPSDGAELPAGRPDPDVEIARLEARLAVDPDDGAAWQHIAPYYLNRAAGSGNVALVDQAEHAVAEATRLRPDDLATYRARGALALTLHQFADAHEIGEEAVAAHPDSPDVLSVLVDASIELGRYDEAEAHLRTLLDLRPNAGALARVSYLREIHGDLAGARLAMGQAEAAAAGDDAETNTIATLVGDLALAAGEPEEALAAFDRAEAHVAGKPLAALGRARALVALGRAPAAIEVLTVATDAFPEPALLTLLGELHEAAGDAGRAEAIYDRTARLIDRHGATGEDNRLEAALFHADHGDHAAAMRFAEGAFADRPTVFTADALVWALTRAGRAREAVDYIDDAARLGTGTIGFHVHAAAALAATGAVGPARAELRAAFELAPWPAPALRPHAAELAAELGVPVPAAWR